MTLDEATILDVIRACELIMEFQSGLTKESFLKDKKTQSAILHQLMVMGEATKRLSDTYRENHPEVPWRLVAGLRDVLIHAYDSVDLEQVWKTIQADVPNLAAHLENLKPSK